MRQPENRPDWAVPGYDAGRAELPLSRRQQLATRREPVLIRALKRITEIAGAKLRRAPEVTTGGKLGHFPLPGQIRHFRRVYIHCAFQRERRLYTFQVDAGRVVVVAWGDFRPAMIRFDLPAGRHPAIPVRGTQDNQRPRRGSRQNADYKCGNGEQELLQISSQELLLMARA